MNRCRRYLSWLAGVGFLVIGAPPVWSGDIASQRQTELRHLLKHDCGSCHGGNLLGGLGPPLTPQALAGKSPELLADTIALGRSAAAMPPWLGLLTRDEINWITEELLRGVAP